MAVAESSSHSPLISTNLIDELLSSAVTSLVAEERGRRKNELDLRSYAVSLSGLGYNWRISLMRDVRTRP